MAFPILEQPTETMITALYTAYFGRAPDPAGLDFWVEQFDTGVAAGRDAEEVLNGISESFRLSEEATDQFQILGSLTSATAPTVDIFLNAVHQNLFNRNMNVEEAETLSEEVTERMQDGVNIGDIIVDIIQDATDGTVIERNQDGRVVEDEAPDVTTLANKLQAGLNITDAFEEGGAAFDGEAAAELLDAVDDSAESVAAQTEAAEALAGVDGGEETQAIGLAGSVDTFDIA